MMFRAHLSMEFQLSSEGMSYYRPGFIFQQAPSAEWRGDCYIGPPSGRSFRGLSR